MLGVLLESRAARQRRGGGATFSIAVHLAIVVLTTAAALGSPSPQPERPQPVVLHFAAPVPQSQPSTSPRALSASLPSSMTFTVLRLHVPTVVPIPIAAVDYKRGPPAEGLALASSGPHAVIGPRSLIDADDHPSEGVWRGTDLLTRIVVAPKPRYPELLQHGGIDGRVLLRFAVDTNGRVDMASVRVLGSTHDLFTRAVLDALPSFRFTPAEVDGHRVAALAEMPFEFRMTR